MLVASYSKQHKQLGFTLIEVLITMVIMAIGLLGLATLQLVGLKSSHSSYLRTQATSLANEYADILRSNPTEVENNKFVADGASFLTSASIFTTKANCTSTTGCSSSDIAETDLANWVSNVQTLPSGNAIIQRSGNTYTMRIFWLDDKNDDDNKGIDIDGDGNNDSGYEKFKLFVTSFQP
jgi:type IV pilus assembly protein PilV